MPAMPIKCSACVLTYNSAKTLEKCLESVKDFTDIVVLDGGSVDGTPEVAKRLGARVYPQRDNGASGKISDFTEIRKKLFNLAAEEWVLWLDSDEWLSDSAVEKTGEVIAGGKKKDLYSFLRKAVIGGRKIEYMYCYPEYCKRLFNKNSGVQLKRSKAVHEDLVPGPDSAIKKLDAVIYHKWDESYGDLKKKDDYYISLMLKGKEGIGPGKKLWIFYINLLKATNVFVKSLILYLLHGFKETLPIAYSWRFVRYHLVYGWKILFV